MSFLKFHILHLLILALSIILAKSYRLQDEAEVSAFCSHKNHYIISPNFTCCNFTYIEPGINLLENWDACTFDGTQDSSKNAHQAAWKVYSCAIKTSNGRENQIGLNRFATLMSSKYSEDIRSKIMLQVASVRSVSAEVSEFDELDKLRRTYYDIERQVCNMLPSNSQDYGKDRSCETWEEDIHRGGRCCGNNSFPFEIGLNSFMDGDLTLKTERCLQQLQNTVFSKNYSWAMENAIADICDLSCELMERDILQPSELQDENLFNIDFQRIASALTPVWLPTQVQADAVAFAIDKFSLNSTIERMSDFEFADVNQTPVMDNQFVELEYVTQRFSPTVVHIPVVCSAHRELLTLIEHFLYTKSCTESVM